MPLRRLGALFAALAMTGFPLAAQSADSTPPPTPGMTGEVIDAQAQIDALKDLPDRGWAYQSIIDLVNDGIIVGYPDGTFKGGRPLTRYEAAVMVERAVQYLTKKLANPQTASDISQKDIDALRALLDEFRGDIIALKLRVDDLDSRMKTVEGTQKAIVAKQQDDEATAEPREVRRRALRPRRFGEQRHRRVYGSVSVRRAWLRRGRLVALRRTTRTAGGHAAHRWKSGR